jgi:hypothetical protein
MWHPAKAEPSKQKATTIAYVRIANLPSNPEERRSKLFGAGAPSTALEPGSNVSDESKPDRRSFLVASAATLAAGSLLAADGCSNHSSAPATALTGAPTSAQMHDFVAVSSALLGIDAGKLSPEPDVTGMKADCFAAAQRSDPQRLAELLQVFHDRAMQPPAAIADAVLNRSGPELSYFAKSVMLAWLLGSWYDPAALQKAVADGTHGPIASSVISPNAYQQSWTWKIAQTKPMGTSSEAPGYWALPPPPLRDFIGGPS